jgi:ABC-type phosphate/phosphonate transport system ATPase subunit
VMELFRALNEQRGITIAFVTHEPDVAAYTRRIVALRDGRIVRDEPNVPNYKFRSSVVDDDAPPRGAVQPRPAPEAGA